MGVRYKTGYKQRAQADTKESGRLYDMEKTIEVAHTKIVYTLRRSKRAKRIRLSVASGGVVTLTAPYTVRDSFLETFIASKASWVLNQVHYFIQFPVRRPLRNRRKHFLEHKENARTLVVERLTHFNQFYGLSWNRIAIRNQRSRWGSCSRRRNLNFNYRIALLPAHLADYIIVHELCHLQEMNHAPAFWDLVARTIPNHQELRRKLRRVGTRYLTT